MINTLSNVLTNVITIVFSYIFSIVKLIENKMNYQATNSELESLYQNITEFTRILNDLQSAVKIALIIANIIVCGIFIFLLALLDLINLLFLSG